MSNQYSLSVILATLMDQPLDFLPYRGYITQVIGNSTSGSNL